MAEAPRSPVGNTVTMDVDLNSSSNNSNTLATDASVTGDVSALFPVDLQCPVTPQLSLKLPDLSSSSSETDEEMVASAVTLAVASVGGVVSTRPISPPPNCAICLGRCKNKCFTDSCMHQFCFKCLCEWSKVKPECPLCKQNFKSIIHNVKSIDQFEEYHVQPPAVQIPHPLEVSYRQTPYILDVLNNPQLEVSLQRLRAVRTILYPSSSTGGPAAPGNSNNAGNIQNQFIHRGELLDMYRQEFPDAIASSGTLSQLWRRYVYDRKLYALPVCDITGRYRESSARFYRDNPAQIHRLMPWINRDIVCLLRNTEHDVSFVLERINEWLVMTNILSPLFRRRLQPILGTKVAHFIHELNNFARSPYDMIGYDRAVQYSPQNTEEIVIEFSTSSSSALSSDDEPVNVVDADNDGAAVNASTVGSEANTVSNAVTERRRPSHRNRNTTQTSTSTTTASRSREYRVQSRTPMVNLLSFTISTTSEGVEAPGVTVAVNGRGSQSAAINLTTHNRATSDVIIDLDDPDIETNANAFTNNYTSGEVPNSSTSSANMVPSSSTTTTTTTTAASAVATTSNSLQLALPTVTENIELSSTSSDECEFVLERKAPHLRTPEMVSLNSESDSDVVFVDESKNKMNYKTTSDEEAKTNPASCTSNVNQLRMLKHELTPSANGSDPDYVYNVGASTSTGLRSSGRGRSKSFSVEKNKLRKRNLRSSKESCLKKSRRKRLNNVATTSRKARAGASFSSSINSEISKSTSSESEEENKRPIAVKKLKRLKRKSVDSRVTRSTNESTKNGARNFGRRTKRKRKVVSENNEAKKSKGMRLSEEKPKNKTENSDDSEFSSTEDAYLSLNKLRTRLIAMQNTGTGVQDDRNAQELLTTPAESNITSVIGNEQEVARTSFNDVTSTRQVQHDEIQIAENREDNERRTQYNEVATTVNDDELSNTCTANNSNSNSFHTINNANIVRTQSITAVKVESTSTSTTSSTALPTEAQPMPTNLQQQHHMDDTTFSSITQTNSFKSRSNSRTSRSSGYTTTTTTTTDSTSSTSSFSSSSSEDSDSDDNRNIANRNLKASLTKTTGDNSDTYSFRLQIANTDPGRIQNMANMPIFSSDNDENNENNNDDVDNEYDDDM